MHHRDNKRFSTTVMGAITNFSAPSYLLTRSTNKEDYVEYLTQFLVHAKLKKKEKAILIYDSHPAHTSKIAQRFMDLHFIAIRVPTHSCELNSIERTWSCAKHYFNKRLLQMREPLTKDVFTRLVLESLHQIPI